MFRFMATDYSSITETIRSIPDTEVLKMKYKCRGSNESKCVTK